MESPGDDAKQLLTGNLQNLKIIRPGDISPGIYTPKTPTTPSSRKFGYAINYFQKYSTKNTYIMNNILVLLDNYLFKRICNRKIPFGEHVKLKNIN